MCYILAENILNPGPPLVNVHYYDHFLYMQRVLSYTFNMLWGNNILHAAKPAIYNIYIYIFNEGRISDVQHDTFLWGVCVCVNISTISSQYLFSEYVCMLHVWSIANTWVLSLRTLCIFFRSWEIHITYYN